MFDTVIFAQLKIKLIALLKKLEYRLQQMITIVPTPDNTQPAIQFGRCGPGLQRGTGAYWGKVHVVIAILTLSASCTAWMRLGRSMPCS